MNDPFQLWLAEYLPAEFDRTVARRVYDALNFRDGDRRPIWEMVENQALIEHFVPDWRDHEQAEVTSQVCQGLGIDVTYGSYYPPSMRTEATENDRQAQTVWALDSPFNSLEKIRAFRPAPLDEKRIQTHCLERWHRLRALHAPRTIFTDLLPSCGFMLSPGRGQLEAFSYALYDARQDLRRIWDHRTEHALIVNSTFAEHRLAPLTQVCEDVAFKGHLVCNPGIMEEEFFPRLAKVIAPLKCAGIKVCFHSDGDITPIIESLIQCGVDMINPVERRAGMQIGALRKKYGKRLMFSGNVASLPLAFGEPADAAQAVRDCVAEVGPGGGHFIQTDSGEFMPDVPLLNGLAYFEAARSIRLSELVAHDKTRSASLP